MYLLVQLFLITSSQVKSTFQNTRLASIIIRVLNNLLCYQLISESKLVRLDMFSGLMLFLLIKSRFRQAFNYWHLSEERC